MIRKYFDKKKHIVDTHQKPNSDVAGNQAVNPTENNSSVQANSRPMTSARGSKQNRMPIRISKDLSKTVFKKIKSPIHSSGFGQAIKTKQQRIIELEQKSSNVSCLYTDYLYKKEQINFLETLANQKLVRKYNTEKKQKLQMMEFNNQLNKLVNSLQSDQQTLKFAYKTLEVDYIELNRKYKDILFKQTQLTKENKNLLSSIANVSKTSKDQNTSIQQITIKSKRSVRARFILEDQQQIQDQVKSIKSCFINQNDQQSNPSRLSILKHGQEVDDEVKISQKINEKQEQEGQDKAQQDFLKMERETIIEMMERQVLKHNDDPEILDFKLLMFDLIDGQEIFRNVCKTEKTLKEIRLTYQMKEEEWKEKEKELEGEVNALTKDIESKQEFIFKQDQIIQEKEKKIGKLDEEVKALSAQISKSKSDIKTLKDAIQRVEEKNYRFMQKEQQKKQELIALKRFTQNLKINDDKINTFLEQEFKDLAPNEQMKESLLSYQEKLSYLTHLYRKKQIIYDDLVKNYTIKMNQYEYLLILTEKKLFQIDKFHQRMLDCMKLEKNGKDKAIEMFINYFNVDVRQEIRQQTEKLLKIGTEKEFCRQSQTQSQSIKNVTIDQLKNQTLQNGQNTGQGQNMQQKQESAVVS